MPDDIANYYAEKDERWVIPVESWETYLARRDASQSENGARNEPPNTSSHTNRDHNGHGSCFRGVRGVDKAGQAGFWLGRYFIPSGLDSGSDSESESESESKGFIHPSSGSTSPQHTLTTEVHMRAHTGASVAPPTFGAQGLVAARDSPQKGA